MGQEGRNPTPNIFTPADICLFSELYKHSAFNLAAGILMQQVECFYPLYLLVVFVPNPNQYTTGTPHPYTRIEKLDAVIHVYLGKLGTRVNNE